MTETPTERWFEGSRWGPEGPPDEAYSRVTNPERFLPLHAAMLGIIDRLENDFEVERRRVMVWMRKLERGAMDLARPSVRLSPWTPMPRPSE